jgi:glycine/D-amino acid oxidase-like deaminating enzyme
MSNSGVTDTSVWTDVDLSRFPVLQRDLDVDVVVVGAGLTGITTAYLLRKEGVHVALLERGRVAGADTSRTTAHLTYVTDQRLYELVDTFGKDAARAFWEAGAAALDQIWQLARETQAECDFRWVPGYLSAPIHEEASRAEREKLQLDATLAAEFGFDAHFMESVPWAHRPGVRFAHQAKFHPLKYLAPMVQAIPGDGSHVFENTSMDEVESKPLTVRASGHRIRCKYLVIATHNPLMGEKGHRLFYAVPDEARLVHQLRARSAAAQRVVSGGALLGHMRSLQLSPHR